MATESEPEGPLLSTYSDLGRMIGSECPEIAASHERLAETSQAFWNEHFTTRPSTKLRR